MNDEDTQAVTALFESLMTAWNAHDAAAFAANFDADGRCIGFDGTEYATAAETEEQLGAIFADHTVATYVYKVRDVTALTGDVALLRAVASMTPPDGGDVMPDRNVVQNVVAVKSAGTWRIALYQNTPAKYDGRPEAVEAFTKELQELVGDR